MAISMGPSHLEALERSLPSEKTHSFDPFESRLCRNVRNGLGQALLAALPDGDLPAVLDRARAVVPAGADSAVRRYVATRIEKYRVLFNALPAAGQPATDEWTIAQYLWDQALFFECHEWLEGVWRQREGATQKMVQALIWAAGAYSHLEYSRIEAAAKLAARAVRALAQYRAQVPAQFDADILIDKLADLDPEPPQFGQVR